VNKILYYTNSYLQFFFLWLERREHAQQCIRTVRFYSG